MAGVALPHRSGRGRFGEELQLPSFIVIGAMKAGTTALYTYLRAHPDVFMSPVKEPNFFIQEKNWGRGLDWYANLFAGAGPAAARGEASTNYTKAPRFGGVPERIAGVLPNVRLIYLVRDPVERIRSQYEHVAVRGQEKRSIEEVALSPSYVDLSRYAFQLDVYREFFSNSQILVVPSEKLLLNRTATLRKIYAFIGVDETFSSEVLERKAHVTEMHLWRSHSLKRLASHVPRSLASSAPKQLRTLWRSGTRKPSPVNGAQWDRVRPILADTLRPDVARLRHELGPEIDGWGLL